MKSQCTFQVRFQDRFQVCFQSKKKLLIFLSFFHCGRKSRLLDFFPSPIKPFSCPLMKNLKIFYFSGGGMLLIFLTNIKTLEMLFLYLLNLDSNLQLKKKLPM